MQVTGSEVLYKYSQEVTYEFLEDALRNLKKDKVSIALLKTQGAAGLYSLHPIII